MSKTLQNKTAVVTGASSGIGREIAVLFAKHGAKVALVGRNIKKLEETKNLVLKEKGSAEIFVADLRNEAVTVGEAILRKLKKVDIIVNVAGVWHSGDKAYYGPRIWETNEEEIKEVMEVGIIAPMLLTKTLLPRMVEQKYGKVINISGTFENGAKGWLHYFVSKKAIEQFTIGLAEEVREHKIQVNCVCPSDTATDSYKKFYPPAKEYEPFETCLNPKDVARLVLQYVGDDFDFITGQIIVARNKNAGIENG
ncbi:MAG: SDR family oxidoreductase [Firmicutes bacterium]|nr:SDR family oxidoreductase [Bacillota bacterium]